MPARQQAPAPEPRIWEIYDEHTRIHGPTFPTRAAAQHWRTTHCGTKTGLNHPGLLGGSRPWKRGWSHGNQEHVGEADHAAVLA